MRTLRTTALLVALCASTTAGAQTYYYGEPQNSAGAGSFYGSVVYQLGIRGMGWYQSLPAYFLLPGASFFAPRTTGKYPVRVLTVNLPIPLASALTCSGS